MKKVLKWTGIVLLILIVLIISAPFIFKDKIIAKVKEEANKSLNAKVDFGKFDLTLISSFPKFTLSINDVSIANVGLFEGDTLFSTKNLTVSLDLMSVIKGEQYSIRSIVFDHPRINAQVLKDGKANWDITKADSAAKPEAASEPAKFKMKLSKFEIKEGYLVYNDASMNFNTTIKGLNHTLSGDFTQDLFDLQTLTSMEQFTTTYEGVTYLNKVKTNLKADLAADMPNFKFTFKQNEIALNELSFGVDGYFAMPKDDMDMDIKFKANQSEFKSFLSLIPAVYSKDFATVKTSGKLAFDGFVKGIYNDKLMPAFGVHVMINDAMFQYPSLPKAVKDITVDIKVDNKDGKPDNTIIDIHKFHVEMAGNPVDVKMHVTTPVSDANIDGSIIGRVNLASLKDVVPMDKGDELNGNITADLKLKGRVSKLEQGKYEEFDAKGQLIVMDVNYKSEKDNYDVLLKSMTLNFSPKFVELAGFDAKMGKSDIKADGRIDNLLQYVFKEQLLTGTFNMKSSLMDLNQFMTGSTEGQTPTPADTASMSVIPVPANIDFTLTTSIGKLLYTNLELSDIEGKVVIKDSRIDLQNLKMNTTTIEGSMALSGYYDTKDVNKPNINFKIDAKDLNVEKTFKTFNTVQKLAPVGKYANGKFSTQLDFIAALDKKMMPVMNTLTGGGKLQTKAVKVEGFGPMNKLADALKMEKFKKADFSDLDLSFRFEDGRVKVDPFDFKLGDVKGKIGGSNGFDQTIDYIWDLQMPRSALGSQANSVISGLVSQANSKGADLSVGDNISLKALFGGTVMNPTVKTSLKDAAGNVKEDLKAKVTEEIDKKKKELEDKAKAEADRLKKEAEDKAKAEADRLKKEAEDAANKAADEAKKKAADEAKKKLKGLFGK
ncbi:MAG: AsmA family protein [Bacteroidetes bacterium]|nr:AsmA family protein [Bacteroidota bacterium]